MAKPKIVEVFDMIVKGRRPQGCIRVATVAKLDENKDYLRDEKGRKIYEKQRNQGTTQKLVRCFSFKVQERDGTITERLHVPEHLIYNVFGKKSARTAIQDYLRKDRGQND